MRSFHEKGKNEIFRFESGCKKLERREELLKLSNDPTIKPLIEKMLFLENQLEMLEKLPMIKVNPNNPEQQKATPAAKQYKEFLQQYTNIVKVVAKATGADEAEETSPLRRWVESRNVS